MGKIDKKVVVIYYPIYFFRSFSRVSSKDCGESIFKSGNHFLIKGKISIG